MRETSSSDGALPFGLELDPFTGKVTGTTSLTGAHTFHVTVADDDVHNSIAPNGATAAITLVIGS